MAGRLAHPQYSKRRVGEPLRAYARRVNAKYDDDWAMKARERRAQHAARLPTPEDQDDAIRRSVESNAARWKLDDDDVWLVRARLAHGGPRRPRSPPQPRQRPRRALNIEYPEAQSLSDYESDSGSESGHLLPDCDSDSNDDGHELCAAPVLAFFPRRRVRPSPQVAAEPLRTKRRREDEDDMYEGPWCPTRFARVMTDASCRITNDIKRCKTDPAVGQTEPIKTSSKRRRDDDGDYNCDEKEYVYFSLVVPPWRSLAAANSRLLSERCAAPKDRGYGKIRRHLPRTPSLRWLQFPARPAMVSPKKPPHLQKTQSVYERDRIVQRPGYPTQMSPRKARNVHRGHRFL